MTDNSRRSVLAAAGIGSVLAIGSIAGAGTVLAEASVLDLEGSAPDGYSVQLDQSGRGLLIDADGVPLYSDDDDYEDEDEDHDEDEGDHEDEYGEAPAAAASDVDHLYSPDEIVDVTDAGTRLILAYDATNEAFSGVVENTTAGPLQDLRVTVRQPSGVELGASDLIDLDAGQTAEFTLSTSGEPFEMFSARLETQAATAGS